jgi:chromosome segregation ATPase
MTESAERLARVETALNTLIDEVKLLRDSTQLVGERITRLEESTKEAIPQVWRLRERVAQLERETAELRLEIEHIKQGGQKTGARWWDIAKMALGPAIAAAVAWAIATGR